MIIGTFTSCNYIWEKMKANLRKYIHASQCFQQSYPAQSQYGQFQDQKDNMRQWRRQPIAH